MHACTAELMFAILVSIAFFTSHWWMENLPQYEDRGTPPIHSIVTLNACVIFLQVLARRRLPPPIPLRQAARLRLASSCSPSVIWTAAVLRRRFPQVTRNLRASRLLLHAHRWPANSSRHRRAVVAHLYRRRSAAHARHGHLHRRSYRRRRDSLRHLHHHRAFVLSPGSAQKGNALCHHATVRCPLNDHRRPGRRRSRNPASSAPTSRSPSRTSLSSS